MKSQLIAAFVTSGSAESRPGARGGNPCLLVMSESAPGDIRTSSKALTVCHSWQSTHANHPVLAVSCYTPDGHAIQCCGHGLLAAAYGWQQRLKTEELHLLMHNSVVQSWQRQDHTWLRFQRLLTHACSLPAWVRQVFPGQQCPIFAATCGGESAYLVLQWPDGFDLEQLAPQLDLLSVHSRRALICTSAQPADGADAIQLRYFAPQYGVSEDAATGSAVRVLADYWASRFASLSARQCSPEGGRLLARVTADHVEVGGRCVTLQRSPGHA